MFIILKKGHQPGVYVPHGALFLVLLLTALPLLPLENEKENGTCLKVEEETL